MDLSLLLIEDDLYKYNDIKKALHRLGITNITYVDNLDRAKLEVLERQELGCMFDLAITDMYYPMRRGGF